MGLNTVLIRITFTGILIAAGYVLQPLPSLFGLASSVISAIAAALIGIFIIVIEVRIQKASLKTLHR